ncbi:MULTISPECIES: hypothetical protein [unclassified Pseudoclavibacter]|uniref:hypothetical protein n=1 Tax=unclassified Pseudoclavibacter TaxID=2615177 RepID=UPI001301700D|nr:MULTISPECIES: hypothetical protein [unclassified Pseudoclavibacter]KAB1645466.1 hypothetical protein F8O06_07700 [Pseudoclavibacter sp. CFCC 14310]KAB1646075.1 hypothetical protein F8O06_04745 [Pseudoclavibacter sp. CFCC 14310]KAB1663617.1 hypothetical protein F8O08_07800 [Pseudoclavibacter sp. CFCC 13611]
MSEDELNSPVRVGDDQTRKIEAFGHELSGLDTFVEQYAAGSVDRVLSRVDVDGVVHLNRIEGAGSVACEVKHGTVLL